MKSALLLTLLQSSVESHRKRNSNCQFAVRIEDETTADVIADLLNMRNEGMGTQFFYIEASNFHDLFKFHFVSQEMVQYLIITGTLSAQIAGVDQRRQARTL
jgi:hypothetical protein